MKKLRLTLIFLLTVAMSSTTVSAQSRLAAYPTGPAPSKADFSAMFPGAKLSEEQKDEKTRWIVEWEDVRVVITPNPAWQREIQLSGMRGWISQFPAKERARKEVSALLETMDRAKIELGIVIHSDFDRKGRARQIVLSLVKKDGGFLFSDQAFYDSTGKLIIGVKSAPIDLGSK